MKMITLSQDDIARLHEQHDDNLVFLYSDFLGAMSAIDDLYEKPAFRFAEEWPYPQFEEAILSNITLIVKAIKKNLPELPRIQEKRGRINLAFCRNLWLHELLLDESWYSEQQKQKYLNFAFLEIFRDFDTKMVANTDIEFFPYDMPWASTSYTPTGSEEDQLEQERSTYHNFYKDKLLAAQSFQAPAATSHQFDDTIYYALRIANKLKDYGRRLMYFNVKRFHLYDEFSQFLESADIPEGLYEARYFLLYYEFKRAMLWNAVFLLKADVFRNFVDFFQEQETLEHVRKGRFEDREKLFRNILNFTPQLEKQESSTSALKFDSKTGMPEMGMGLQSPEFDYSPMRSSRETAPISFVSSDLGAVVSQDYDAFIDKWVSGVRAREVYFVIDNAQLLDKKGKDLFKLPGKSKIAKGSKFVHRGIDNQIQGIETIVDIATPPLHSLELNDATLREILPYLATLGRFDRKLVESLADHLNLEWNDEHWENLGHLEMIRVHSKHWFYCSLDDSFLSFGAPKSLDQFPKASQGSILNHLKHYEGETQEETTLARLDALQYGFDWNPDSSASDWLAFWLNALKKHDFTLAEKTIAVGYRFQAKLLKTLGTSAEQLNQGPFAIREPIQQFLQAGEKAGLKKLRKKWLKTIQSFCQEGMALQISDKIRALFLEVGNSLLKKHDSTKRSTQDFMDFCESGSIRDCFSSEAPH